MSQRPLILNDILIEAKTQKAINVRMKAVFDLDSTLFDVSPRIAKVLLDFANDPEMKRLYPAETEVISQVEAHSGDYGVRRTLERYNFNPPSVEFAQILTDYWKKYFFSNEYLQFDTPYAGAQPFVSELYLAGADIRYLTGRDIPRMLKGTIESLKAHGFPLDQDHANLVLKPDSSIKDTEFKRDYFLNLDRAGAPVYFFENEPANIHLVLEHCPHIKVIFVETVHSEKAPLPGDHVPKITGW